MAMLRSRIPHLERRVEELEAAEETSQQLREQVTRLESKLDTSEKEVSRQQSVMADIGPLLTVGVAIRRRFLEKASQTASS